MAGYVAELAETRDMLNSRYDDLKSDRVKPIPSDEVEAYFRGKERCRSWFATRLMTGYEFHPEAHVDLAEIGNSFERIISMPPTG
ncbi:MAG TPA: hypothetical protein VN924_13725 [Bryobacteraceae bacterium]|nr:hypothetical protein [Bryobacteraceae bacterium]